jgi:hypothetical protein
MDYARVLFLLIIIGIAVNRLNIVRSEDKRVLTDLVIGLFLPASIINSFQMSFDSEVVKTFGILLGLSTLSMVISYALVLLYSQNVTISKKQRYDLAP